jgi:hypothetical protein
MGLISTFADLTDMRSLRKPIPIIEKLPTGVIPSPSPVFLEIPDFDLWPLVDYSP